MSEPNSLAEGLIGAMRSGQSFVPADSMLPETLEAAEIVQDEVLRAMGPKVAGWKLGGSNHASRTGLGLARPFAGLIPDSGMIPNGASRPITSFRQPGAECELAVILGKDLPVRPGGYSRSEVLDAVARTITAIEVPETRFRQLAIHGGLALVADNGAAGYAVAGDGIDGAAGLDDMTRNGELRVDGELLGEGGVNQLVARPSDLLTDHVNRLGERGWAHHAGQVILLGALTPRVGLEGPARVVASVEGLGDAALHFAAAS